MGIYDMGLYAQKALVISAKMQRAASQVNAWPTEDI